MLAANSWSACRAWIERRTFDAVTASRCDELRLATDESRRISADGCGGHHITSATTHPFRLVAQRIMARWQRDRRIGRESDGQDKADFQLVARDTRRALGMFADLIVSPHLPTAQITGVALGAGKATSPEHLMIMRSVFCLAARCADVAVNAPYLARAGKQKTDWTKSRCKARYGDCIASPFDRNRCELVRRARAGAGSDDTGRCSDTLAPDRSGT